MGNGPATTELQRQEGDDYGLQRTYVSSIRLNAQHYLWKDAVGFNVHPDVPVQNAATYRVADIGTGTGIWVYDLKREYPEIEVDGFDISLEQCPDSDWMPAGSSLKQLDMTKPIPAHLENVYDFVNIRLFLVVVKENDPLPILRNIKRMLKPGGWLQWCEHVLTDIELQVAREETPHCAMRSLAESMQVAKVGLWIPRLPEILASEGFTNARLQKYAVHPASRIFWTQMQFNSTMDFSYVAMDNSSLESAGPQLRELIARAVLEARDGIALSFKPAVVVAQAPET